MNPRLLPIVDAVAAGATISGPWTALAAREAARARRLIGDGRVGLGPGFADLLSDVRDTFAEAGMPVSAVFRILADPPAEIGEAVAYAVREALTNVLKHADPRGRVTCSPDDRRAARGGGGTGRDSTGRGVPGMPGFARPYETVRHLGGTVDVRSGPGAGTRSDAMARCGMGAGVVTRPQVRDSHQVVTIVDDHPIAGAGIAAQLRQRGFDVAAVVTVEMLDATGVYGRFVTCGSPGAQARTPLPSWLNAAAIAGYLRCGRAGRDLGCCRGRCPRVRI